MTEREKRGGRVPEPTVCCIMLTRDRPAMTARAVASFRAQTYERKRLLVYDTGKLEYSSGFGCGPEVYHVWAKDRGAIGELRNHANGHWTGYDLEKSDIIAHFDSDDWSHPQRLAEQVALLQSSGADCVGYNDALCWDTRISVNLVDPLEDDYVLTRKAWLYANHVPPTYALGGSFCYWRRVWEAHPFEALNHGEDERWRTKIRSLGVSSFAESRGPNWNVLPRFIIGVHGDQTSSYNMAGLLVSYRRVPEWDGYCAARMALEVRA